MSEDERQRVANTHSDLLTYIEDALALLDEHEPDFASESPHVLAELRGVFEQVEALGAERDRLREGVNDAADILDVIGKWFTAGADTSDMSPILDHALPLMEKWEAKLAAGSTPTSAPYTWEVINTVTTNSESVFGRQEDAERRLSELPEGFAVVAFDAAGNAVPYPATRLHDDQGFQPLPDDWQPGGKHYSESETT